ncbi:MAG: hypothetical protein K0Q81_1917 [Paenibacillus sp.]|jgi:hypothetical protein|nr:hypothetical protein [Paenibacillus sp.]
MRDTKYRGIRIDNKEWVYGYLIGKNVIVGEIVEWDSEYFNTEFWRKVDPETVGQYNNYFGLEFHDGDIISIACDCDSEYGCTHPDGIYVVVWNEYTAGYALKSLRTGYLESLDNYGVENMHVIGNRWEHPHLLGGHQA